MELLALIQSMSALSIIIFIVGVILLIVEMCTPGFGVAGGLGLVCLVVDIFITAKTFTQGLIMTGIVAVIVVILAVVSIVLVSKGKMPASLMLFVVGVSGMVTGVVWAVAGDMGGRAFSSTVVGVLDWSVYMGAAIQASVFGWVKDHFGWSAIFVTIGCLYIIMLILTLMARKMKMRKL